MLARNLLVDVLAQLNLFVVMAHNLLNVEVYDTVHVVELFLRIGQARGLGISGSVGTLGFRSRVTYNVRANIM